MGKLYSAPSLDPQKQIAVARGDFDFLMPFQKDLLRTDEVAKVIGRSMQFVRELVEQGRLEAHQDSAYGKRASSLITRRSVILYLAEIANYDSGFLVLRMETLLKKLDPHSLDRLALAVSRQRHLIQ